MHRPTAGRAVALLLVALTSAIALQVAPASPAVVPARAEMNTPKAVFIVGPTGDLTDQNLTDAERMARQAEAAGMDVRRVFFPRATWQRVLANVQGASLVVYMGHGYGWPSPYTSKMTESRQNGMGLNSFDGSGRNEYTYYGATRIRESIRLAPNAVVLLNHLCYASGNAEAGMPIPGPDLARERVDNMANGWLAVGARVVFAYAFWQRLNYPNALMTTNQTMDQLFMSPADGTPNGFIGWNNRRFDSERTPGAVNHLDPHPRLGYYRAVTGDLDMKASEFRGASTDTPTDPDPDPELEPEPDDAPPEITSLSAQPSASGASLDESGPVAFHPNGDGIDDQLVVTHNVSEAAYLDVTVTNEGGGTVRRFTAWSARGSGTTRWDGRTGSGPYAPDGIYTLTYVPRDEAGLRGTPVAIRTLVLTAVRLGKPSSPALYASDGDRLSKAVKLPVRLNQSATVDWAILDSADRVVRTVRSRAPMAAGLVTYAWDGRRDDRSWAAEGWYRSVVTAETSLGTYTQERRVYAGAFRITPSTSTPARGGKLTLTIVSTESLSRAPRVTVARPGVALTTYSTRKIATRKYRVTFSLSGGSPGTLELVVRGTDSYGGKQQARMVLPLA